MWVQRKIIGRLHGMKVFDFDASIGYKMLTDCLDHYGHEHAYTALVPDLSGDVDPDDTFSSVPYEKGFYFLLYLCHVAGGHDAFDPFFKEYVKAFSFKTITSEEFRDFYLAYFTGKVDADKLAGIEWERWFHAPGGLPVRVPLDTSIRDAASTLAAQWLAAVSGGGAASVTDAANYSTFTPGQRVAFFDELLVAQDANGAALDSATLDALDAAYSLSSVRNSEIRFRWLRLCIRAEHASAVPNAVAFVTSQGRMKFCRPLYRDLFKSACGKAAALEAFAAFRKTYHPITAKMVAVDLQLRDTA